MRVCGRWWSRPWAWVVCWVIATMVAAHPAQARDLFRLTVTTGGVTETATFSSVQNLIDTVDTGALARLQTAYTTAGAASAELDLRGVPVFASFAAGSTTLRVNIPALGISETFTGPDRFASRDAFVDWLRNDEGGVTSALLKELAGRTPIDPVAGNPGSLMGRMIAADFAAGTAIAGGQPWRLRAGGPEAGSGTFRLGISGGRYEAGDWSQQDVTLPLGYAYSFDDPRYRLIVDLPLTVTETAGGRAYAGSLGLGLRMPLVSGDWGDWAVTPMLRGGATGSVDLGSAATVTSLTVASNVDWYTLGDGVKLSLGNAAGLYQVRSIDAGDLELNYDLRNGMTRHGIAAEARAGRLFGREASFHAGASVTLLTGDPLAVERWLDLTLSYGTVSEGRGSGRLGLTLTRGFEGDYQGARLSLSFAF